MAAFWSVYSAGFRLAATFAEEPTSIGSSTLISNSNSLAKSGMPNQVGCALLHAVSGTKLSRARTEL